MRFIQQQAEPRSFQEWKRANAITAQNLHYDNVPSAVREDIKTTLRLEQGGLCGYTMKRMDSNDKCHIEHIAAQSSNPEKELDYSNMLACIPLNGGDTKLGYGAAFKGDKLVASPHHQRIEHLFLYDSTGLVNTVADADELTAKSIEHLNLNHPSLREERLAALSAVGLPIRHSRMTKRPTKLLTASQAKILAKRILEPNDNKELPPFCLAISQVAESYALQVEKIAQRLKSVRK